MPAKLPHVALLIETSRSYGRGLLRGVRRYISEHGPWSVYLELRALDSPAPPWLRRWRGDGILSRTGSRAMLSAVRQARVPTVELRASRLKHPFPSVGVDNRALGRMVAEHLLERGFRRFGVYEIDTEIYFEQRRDDFVRTLAGAGYPCEVYRAPGHRERPLLWEKHQNDLARWVKALPKPAGIMACTDQLGFWLLDACRRAGVAVPEEVAVVGVENEQALCTMASPPLSSVRFNPDRIGYEAAALLDRMMRGGSAPRRPILIEPIGIVTRQSSDIIAIDDPLVAQALRFIRQRACEGIGVEDVLDAVPVSRSSLERRMRRVLGRSPKAQILSVRLDRVRQLLGETDLSLSAIAQRTGFKHPQYLSAAFKKSFGQTPGEYRGPRTPPASPAPRK